MQRCELRPSKRVVVRVGCCAFRTLAATEDRELVALPAFSGGPEQLWRIDQLTNGTSRVMPKAVPNAKEPLALSGDQ